MNLANIPRPFPKIAGAMQRSVRWLQRMMRVLACDGSPTMPEAGMLDHYQTNGTELRRHPRVPLRNITVHVTDGCLFATAVMENISPDGLCLSRLPEQLYNHGAALTVYSSNNPGLPVLQIQPRWQKNGWNGKTIGAAIIDVTESWRLFFVHTASQQTA